MLKVFCSGKTPAERFLSRTELISHQPRHHRLHPLLSDNRISRFVDCVMVGEIDPDKCRRHGRLLRQESCRFRSGHHVQLLVVSVGARFVWREEFGEGSSQLFPGDSTRYARTMLDFNKYRGYLNIGCW